MDAAKRKALVTRLADAKNFDKEYPKVSREWFVLRLIRTYDAQLLGDAQIEAKTTEVVTKSLPIVTARKGFIIGISHSKATEVIQAPRRVEILYGAIATHPEFVDAAHGDLLEWIARRRLRGVTRMDVFVNPNSQGYFRYPRTCSANQTWRVNVDAQPYWESAPPPPEPWPIPLKRPTTGSPDIVQALAKLFTAKSTPCDGNLLDCALTAGAVLLDSLLEAKDPVKLLKELDDRVVVGGRTNVALHHITKATQASYIGDDRPTGLFERANVLVGDLQVGDHVYVFNHPLYKVFHPNDDWTGEHSLIYNGGDRDPESKAGYRLGGHGKEGTVYSFYADFLKELQTDLHRAFRIGGIFLAWKRSGGTIPATAQVMTASTTAPFDGGTVAVDLHQFDVDYKYPDYTKAPKKGKRPEKRETGFVIAHVASLRRFLILKARRLTDVDLPTWTAEAITFQRSAAAGAEFDPVPWAIMYLDLSKVDEDPATPLPALDRWELFERKGSALGQRMLTIDDLFKSPFAKWNVNAQEIGATRPRVSFTAAYKTFLSASGAI